MPVRYTVQKSGSGNRHSQWQSRLLLEGISLAGVQHLARVGSRKRALVDYSAPTKISLTLEGLFGKASTYMLETESGVHARDG